MLALLVAAGGVAGTVQPSLGQTSDETTITECTVVTEPGSYVLGSDVGPGDGDGPCLEIVADSVTLDGDGYTVDGSVGLGDTRELDRAEVREVVVRDLTATAVLTTRSVADVVLDSVDVAGGMSGLFFSNVTITDSRLGGGGFYVDEDSSDITIRNSTFDGVQGVRILESLQGARIVNNEFDMTGPSVFGVVDIQSTPGDTDDVLVANNSIDAGGKAGISTSEGVGGIEVRDNVVTNASVGIDFLSSGLITGNEVTESDVGISIAAPVGLLGDLEVEGNTITDNRVGVSAAYVDEDAMQVRDNAISENSEFGVRVTNSDGAVLDARNNSWGDPSGPSSAPANDSDAPFADPVAGALADGDGDAVSEGDVPGVSNVRFDPFLPEPTDQNGSPTPITECTAIAKPGKFVLENDLVASGEEACLRISAVGAVSIDGAGYGVTGGIDGDPEPSSGDTEERQLDLNLRDLTVDVVVYPFGGLVGDGASGTLENVTAERLDVGTATGWTIESSRIESGISGLYAGPLTVRDSHVGGSGIQFDEDAGPVVLENNTFDGRSGVAFTEDLENARIVDNRFEGTGLFVISIGDGTRDVLVAGNRFDGGGIRIQGGIPVSNVTVRDNVVTNTTVGIALGFSDIRIVGNEIRGNDVGIEARSNAIVDNRITDNRIGVRVRDSLPVIRENVIAGNEEFGVQNVVDRFTEGFLVDARFNDWGDSSGPSSAPVSDADAPFADPVTGTPADGSGDAVSEGRTPGVSNVRFDPVLTDGEGPPLDPETVYYPVDFVVGEPIERFGSADSGRFYSDQGRLIRYLHGSTETPVDRIGAPSTLRDRWATCIDVESFTVEDGTATIRFNVGDTGDDRDCRFATTLAVYEKPGPGWNKANASEQRLFDLDEFVVFGPGTYETTVEVPTGETTTATESRSVRVVTTVR